MRIGVDVDEVIFPMKKYLYMFLNDKFKTDFDFQNPHYDFGVELNLSYEDREDLFKEFTETSYFMNMPPIGGAVNGLLELKKFSDGMDAITSRQNYLEDATKRAFGIYIPGVFDSIQIGNHHNQYDKNERSKLEMIRDVVADMMIEEQIKYAIQISQAGIPVILPDKPWNRNFEGDLVYRVRDWKEIVDKAKELMNV